jgi:hypothetical protein
VLALKDADADECARIVLTFMFALQASCDIPPTTELGW